jgi:predicted DNA-binding protein
LTRTNISLPLELKEKAKRNGKHRGIKALSTYIQYLIEADDHLIQDEKMARVPTEAQLAEMERAFKC